MIEDDHIKQALKIKQEWDSPLAKEALKIAEDHKKLLSSLGVLGKADDLLGSRKFLQDFIGMGSASEQMAKKLLDMGPGSASESIANSVFGRGSMSAIESAAKELIRKNNELSSLVKPLLEQHNYAHIGTNKLAELVGHVPAWVDLIPDLTRKLGAEYDLTHFKSQFGSISRIAEEAAASMRLVRWDNIAALNVAPILKNSLEFRTLRLNTAFDAFAGVMAREPKVFLDAPPFVAKTPTIAVFTHAEALRSISLIAEDETEQEQPENKIWIDARDETFAAIEDLLPRFNPELMTSWKGGWNTADMRTEDWARQASSSFRFVLIKTIDTAAPQERVKADLDPKQIKNNKATRKQQAAWLCRSLKSGAYRDMVIADIESAIGIIDVFSQAVHEFRNEDIEKSFSRMAVRASVALGHILDLYFNG